MFREGSNVKKSPENGISIAKLLSLPEQEQNKR
jgi:hypothetical protein